MGIIKQSLTAILLLQSFDTKTMNFTQICDHITKRDVAIGLAMVAVGFIIYKGITTEIGPYTDPTLYTQEYTHHVRTAQKTVASKSAPAVLETVRKPVAGPQQHAKVLRPRGTQQSSAAAQTHAAVFASPKDELSFLRAKHDIILKGVLKGTQTVTNPLDFGKEQRRIQELE